jgi:hypothetical protein
MLGFDLWKYLVVLVEVRSNEIKLIAIEKTLHLSLSLLGRKGGVWISDFFPDGCFVIGCWDESFTSEFAVLS